MWYVYDLAIYECEGEGQDHDVVWTASRDE
jgi:hypothetical protein